MTKINPQNIVVGSFGSLWAGPFQSNKDRCFHLYEKMRHTLPPSVEKDIAKEMAANNPFALVWSNLCWENIIVPIFILNGGNLGGRFKVLTNAKKEKYHFVIFDSETNTVYDPTYEKYPDSQLLAPKNLCAGTNCTKPMLGKSCHYFDLGYYLREFELQGNESFMSQLREYGSRFLDAVAVEAKQEKC